VTDPMPLIQVPLKIRKSVGMIHAHVGVARNTRSAMVWGSDRTVRPKLIMHPVVV
jgi:hypothetical protein